MSNPVCISPLKFYDSLAKQSHRKSYAYNHITPVIAKTGWIPPFQFVIPTQLFNNASNISEFKIYDAKSNIFIADIPKEYISIVNIDNCNVLVYKGKNRIDAEKKIYTEDFNIICSSENPFWSNGSIYYFNTRNSTDFIKVQENEKIVYNLRGDNTTRVMAFDLNKQPLVNKASISIDDTGTYIVPADVSYVKLYILNENATDEPFGNAVFSIGENLYNLQEGLYYLKLASNNGGLWTYYSEVFCFTNVTKDCLELEYWNETGNFAVKNGVIAFPDNFHFKLLLKTEIGKPEYNFEEESTKRLGYVYIESQVSKKTYKFNVVVPEYICDALRIVRLCDNKIIRCKDDEYEAITFEMEAEWQTQGDLASVTCEFETDNVVANIGGFVPDKLGGDYNNDYNEDFDKE